MKRVIAIFLAIIMFHGYSLGDDTKEYREGDKVPIEVEAPFETERIEAVITTTRKIELIYDEEQDKWIGEWTVPSDAGGEHTFKIIVVDFEGYVTEAETDKFIVIRKATEEELARKASEEAVGLGGPVEFQEIPVEKKEVVEEKVDKVKEVKFKEDEIQEEAKEFVVTEDKKAVVKEEVIPEEPKVVEAPKEEKVVEKPVEIKEEPIVEHKPVVEPEKVVEKKPIVEEVEVAAVPPKTIVKKVPEEVKVAEKPKEVKAPPVITPDTKDRRGPGGIVRTHNLLSEFQTYVKTLVVTGVVGKDVRQIKINGEIIRFDEEGKFMANIPLEYGKNSIKFEVETYSGEIISKHSKMLRLVAQIHEFDYQTREQVVNEMPQEKRLGLTLFGMYLGRYVDLASKITRAEAAKFIAKLYDYAVKPVSKKVFYDIPLDSEYSPYIKVCKEKEVFEGYPDGKFKPWKKISIAEFAAALCEVEDLLDKGKRVNDEGFWAKDNITALKDGTYMKFPYIAHDSYYNRPILVEKMIEALNKTNKMKEKQAQLLDFESGY